MLQNILSVGLFVFANTQWTRTHFPRHGTTSHANKPVPQNNTTVLHTAVEAEHSRQYPVADEVRESKGSTDVREDRAEDDGVPLGKDQVPDGVVWEEEQEDCDRVEELGQADTQPDFPHFLGGYRCFG